MIDILGFKRILILGILGGVTALLAATLYMYLVPQLKTAEQDLQAAKRTVTAKRNDLADVRQELSALSMQKDTFDELQKTGFFSRQDRFLAKDRIEEIQDLSSVLSVRYKINPAKIETNPQLEKAKHVMLASPFEVQIEALDDVDVYRFLYLLRTSFPGYASFDSVKLSRGEEVSDKTLRSILTDEPVALVESDIKFTWRTILPEGQVSIPKEKR